MRAHAHLTALLRDILAEKGVPWPEKAVIEPPRDKKHGDLAANVALVAAGAFKMPPRAAAEAVRQALLARDPSLVVDVAGPGFLNVTLAPDFWRALVAGILEQGANYGRLDLGRGKRVQVEYVSANPTGPLHIGHGRGAAVGDSLARVLDAAGYAVSTEYYINDAGRQMRILGESIRVRLANLLGRETPEPEDFYKGAYIIDLARELADRHGAALLDLPEDEARAICQDHGVARIMAGIRQDLRDFRVGHEVWFSETSLLETGRVAATLDDLKARGLAYEKDGALWFASSRFGDDKDRVLRKSSGELTYFASDMAYHADKFARGFDLVIDIWGADHHGYVPRMKACAEALSRDREDIRVVLVNLVTLLRAGQPVAMSTRAGEFETLHDVVAETGADAARFMFLSRKSDSPLDFDLELVKQKTMDNPVYYVQYAHARVMSLRAKAAGQGLDPSRIAAGPEVLAALSSPADLALARLLDEYPDAVAGAAENLAPHQISYYLRELAVAMHRYYTDNPVLAAGDETLTLARLCLLSAGAWVIRNGLGLLGVEAPDRM